MQAMLFGIVDREDGGYLQEISFDIPESITTFEDGYEYLKSKPDFINKLVTAFGQDLWSEELEEEVTVLPENLTNMSWNYGLDLTFETGEDEFDLHLAVDFINVVNLKT